MQYRALGRTGLQISVVSMGTWNTFDVRGKKDIEHVCQLVTEAIGCGVNLFDTVPVKRKQGQKRFALTANFR